MIFTEFASYLQKLEKTDSRNTITQILSELFQKVTANEIGKICYLLSGRVRPLYEAIEFGVADKFMVRAIARAYRTSEEEVKKAFKKEGDLGSAAEILSGKSPEGKMPSIQNVYESLYAVATFSGEGSQEKKIALLSDILSSVDGLSARYIARIPLDKLRLGFSDMTILDALSWMKARDKSLREKLEAAYNVRPDIGFLAKTIKEKGISGLSHIKARVGAPILASLCQRLPTADEMIKKMGKVAVEPKYDGVRVQIHLTSDREGVPKVKTFSRNLENTTDMFPELESISKQLKEEEVILDSEAVGFDSKTGKLIPFQETMTRKRKHGIDKAMESVPLRFFVFDILYKNGHDLLNLPLWQRRKILEETIIGSGPLVISPQIITDKAQEIREYHDRQLKKGLEGAVVKRWDSPYEPGRRGFSWVKFKEEEGKTGKLTDTIDAVVMGYYRGQGKRAEFGIGAFLVGVKKEDGFVTVTKIGTGVSDQLWRELLTKLNHIRVKEKPKEYFDVNKLFIPDVWVAPWIVVEVAGDDLTKSPTHGAGIAMRFPRLVRIRTDKSPLAATTVAEVEKMYKNQ